MSLRARELMMMGAKLIMSMVIMMRIKMMLMMMLGMK